MENNVIDLATKYSDQVDELFSAESILPLIATADYDFSGAQTVKVYTVSTQKLTDYDRNGGDSNRVSRYGVLSDLAATTQQMILSRDRSFAIVIDRLDEDETNGALDAANALAREIRLEVTPEIETYSLQKIVAGAGHVEDSTTAIDADNIYTEILDAGAALDEAETPLTQRVLLVTPKTYTFLKRAAVFDSSEVGTAARLQGVVQLLDGASVVKTNRLPTGTDFVLLHPLAVCLPLKLQEALIHTSTPLASGSILTGRFCYDCFIMNNKKKSIYVRKTTGD